MTRAQWVILIWLERQSGLSQNELATLVEVEPITVGRLVDRPRGLVYRGADPKDRRVWRPRLTPAANAVLGRAMVQTMTDVLIRMKANLLAELRDTPKGERRAHDALLQVRRRLMARTTFLDLPRRYHPLHPDQVY
jgi:DNA-binding MarR family transcriptional regulator